MAYCLVEAGLELWKHGDAPQEASISSLAELL